MTEKPPLIFRNAPAADPRPPTAPVKADGSPYRFEMLYDGFTRRAYADTLTDLCRALIPDYDPDAGDEDLATARILYAVRAQVELQAEICAATDLSGCSSAERSILLGNRTEQPHIAIWTADIPLVLVDIDYEPLGTRPRPTGNIIWLEPIDEHTLLTSLHRAGIIHLNEARGSYRGRCRSQDEPRHGVGTP
ncbi:MAG: hypothetical protein IT198_17335 [Acidimicrobiia bacterium]|nr:hypothetical protein [Acidimicrobiia bacterium]